MNLNIEKLSSLKSVDRKEPNVGRKTHTLFDKL